MRGSGTTRRTSNRCRAAEPGPLTDHEPFGAIDPGWFTSWGAHLADIPSRSGSSPASREPIGRIISISGAQATVTLAAAALCGDDDHATVGRFLAILSGPAMIIGLISELDEDQIPASHGAVQARSIARLELIGELRTVAGAARFQRGIESYPKIGDGAVL